MKIFYRFFIILIFGSGSLFAQPTVFQKITDNEWKEEEKFTRMHFPETYLLYSFYLKSLLEVVKNAPYLSNEPSSITLNIPDENGSFQPFWIYDNLCRIGAYGFRYEVNEKELILKFDQVRVYLYFWNA